MNHNEFYLKDLETISSFDLPWDDLKNRTILITGATGLIGKCFIDFCMFLNKKNHLEINVYACARTKEKLEEEFSIYFDLPTFHILVHDVKKPLLEDYCFDYIVHAASNADPKSYATDPIGTIKTNVDGIVHLLEYGKTHEMKRFLFLSSVEVYGENKSKHGDFKEEDLGYINCNLARSCYPESKRLAETYCAIYHDVYGLDIVIARLSRIYGPTYRKGDSKAIFQFIEKTLKKEDIVLKSEGNQIFSYCYVIDAILGMFFVLLKGNNGEAYNITNNKSVLSLREIAEYLASLNQKQVVFEFPSNYEKKGFSGLVRSTMNTEKIEKLGFVPTTSMEEGLLRTVNILSQKKP